MAAYSVSFSFVLREEVLRLPALESLWVDFSSDIVINVKVISLLVEEEVAFSVEVADLDPLLYFVLGGDRGTSGQWITLQRPTGASWNYLQNLV